MCSSHRWIMAGELVVIGETPDERYYKQLPGEERALQLGPFPRYFLERTIEYLAWVILASTLGGALYFRARPLWRDMLALEQGANAIGQGKLDTRGRYPVDRRSVPENAIAHLDARLVARALQNIIRNACATHARR